MPLHVEGPPRPHHRHLPPLLGEIAGARYAMLQAEARMRLLIAYGREFTRPRPYRLEDLARTGLPAAPGPIGPGLAGGYCCG